MYDTPLTQHSSSVSHIAGGLTNKGVNRHRILKLTLTTTSCRSGLNPVRVLRFSLYFLHLNFIFSSFWTSRGHRCRPFISPVLAFVVYRAKSSEIPMLVDYLSNVANSRSRAFRTSIFGICTRKSSYKFLRVCILHSAGIELKKLTYTRFDYNLIRHRSDRVTANHVFTPSRPA